MRTVTFTMEDALISPEGFMILSGAGLIEASADTPVYQHMTETVDANGIQATAGDDDEGTTFTVKLTNKPYLPTNKNDNFAYVMFMKNGEIVSEPYIPEHAEVEKGEDGYYTITVKALDNIYTEKVDGEESHAYSLSGALPSYDSVMVDYYVEKQSGAKQIEITPDKFGGNYYLEASTLFRDQNGVDMPAEFIIPNCKIQSNFTFTMASSGDPSSFTFTMDAFPDYTKFDKSQKVLATIQVIEEAASQDIHRHSTVHEAAHDDLF